MTKFFIMVLITGLSFSASAESTRSENSDVTSVATDRPWICPLAHEYLQRRVSFCEANVLNVASERALMATRIARHAVWKVQATLEFIRSSNCGQPTDELMSKAEWCISETKKNLSANLKRQTGRSGENSLLHLSEFKQNVLSELVLFEMQSDRSRRDRKIIDHREKLLNMQ